MKIKRKILFMIAFVISFMAIMMLNTKVHAAYDEERMTGDNRWVREIDISQAGNRSCMATFYLVYENSEYGIPAQPARELKSAELHITGSGTMKDNPFEDINIIQFYQQDMYSSPEILARTPVKEIEFLNVLLSDGRTGGDITNIGAATFKNFKAKNISTNIPPTVTKIGEEAFMGTSIEIVGIGSNINEIGDKAFYNCKSLKWISVSNENEHYSDRNGILFNKDQTKILAYPINYTIEYNNGVTTVETVPSTYIVPDTVREIGTYAFADVKNLNTVVVPNTVETIGNKAFAYSGITSIELPESLNTIEESVFYDCDNLEFVRISGGVQSIKNGAFSSCSNLQEVIIPSNVTEIADNAFENCNKLHLWVKENSYAKTYAEEKNISYSIYNENGDFDYIENTDSSITIIRYKGTDDEVTIPNEIDGKVVKAIGDGTFETSDIKKITLPENIVNIGNYAFKSCGELETINIPNTVRKIGRGAFQNCPKLESDIVIPEGVNVINDDTFNGCLKLKNIQLPLTIKYIGDRAFAYCTDLENIELPDEVETIGDEAFDSCYKLERLFIPDSVTTFGENSFNHTILTIECNSGSAAEQYARENNIRYTLLNEDIPGEDPTGGNTAGNNTAGNNTSGNNTAGGNTSGNNTSGGNTSENNTTGGNTTGNNTAGGNTSKGNTTGGNTTNRNITKYAGNVNERAKVYSPSILPKTGIGKFLLFISIIVVASSITFYVKYKRTY